MCKQHIYIKFYKMLMSWGGGGGGLIQNNYRLSAFSDSVFCFRLSLSSLSGKRPTEHLILSVNNLFVVDGLLFYGLTAAFVNVLVDQDAVVFHDWKSKEMEKQSKLCCCCCCCIVVLRPR